MPSGSDNVQRIGVILAGGKSSRMGSDKRYLNMGGTTLLEKARKVLEALSVDEVIICANDIEGALKDINPGCGPMSGIDALCHHFFVRHQQVKHLIVIPTDMPLLEASHIGALITAGINQKKAAYYADFPLPFFAVMDRVFVSTVEQLMKSKQYQLRGLLNRLPSTALSFPTMADKRHGLMNVNTPSQWQELQQNIEDYQ